MIEMPSYHAIAAMLVTLAMFIAFARGRTPVEIVSLFIIAVIAVGLYFFPMPGDIPTDGLELAFSGFGHYALITICSLMILGRGLVVTGALEPAANLLEQVWKVNLQVGLLISLLIAFSLSMFINDTPVLVLLLPIFAQLAQRGAMPTSKTLMPLNAAVLIGGMATTIGTSTNLLVVSIATDLGMPQMRVFHYAPIVLVAGLVALPYLWLVMPRLLGDNTKIKSADERRFRARMRLGPESFLTGRELSQVLPRMPSDLEFLDAPDRPFAAQDQISVRGTHSAMEEAMRSLKGEIAPGWVIDQMRRRASDTGEDILSVEMAVTQDSRLVGRTLATSGVADLYGVAILGVHRPQPVLGETSKFSEGGDMHIEEGDVLLVMGLKADLTDFARSDSLLQLDGARELPRRSKALLALGIMIGSVVLASLGLLPIAISALAGAILMFVTGCVKFDRVGRALSAKVIVLVAASISLGDFVLQSGAAEWLGMVLAAGLQYLAPAAILAAIMLFVTFLTNFASNATAATIGTPIAWNIANQLGLPSEPLILAVLFGCNLCYATPIAYQTNMLIMAEGNYQFKDYMRAGIPLVLLMVATLSFLLVFTYDIR